MEAPQRLPGIDAELIGEQVADPPVGGQRVSLPAAPVQRQYQLAVQPLPQRVAAASCSSSAVSASCRPSARSASIRVSTAVSRSSSSRAASGRVKA